MIIFIPIPAVLKVPCSNPSFSPIAALLTVTLAAVVECYHRGHDLPQIQGVEGVFEHGHLGIGTVALVPTVLLADDRSGRGYTALPVDAVQAHDPDGTTIDLDYEHDVRIRLLGESLDPLPFPALRHRQYVGDVLADFRIVEPAQEKRDILFRDRPQDNFPSKKEDDPVFS